MKSKKIDVSSTANGLLYFMENSIQIEFGSEGAASFIGISPHTELRLVFRGINLFDHDATEVFSLFQQYEDDENKWAEQYEHIFPKQIISVWDADTQYDLKGRLRRIWGQIGVGNSAYLNAVSDQ